MLAVPLLNILPFVSAYTLVLEISVLYIFLKITTIGSEKPAEVYSIVGCWARIPQPQVSLLILGPPEGPELRTASHTSPQVPIRISPRNSISGISTSKPCRIRVLENSPDRMQRIAGTASPISIVLGLQWPPLRISSSEGQGS